MARQIAAREPHFVLTARGTSDNAGLYAKYLLEIQLGLPCGLTSMSTSTAYGARPDLTDVLVVTVSRRLPGPRSLDPGPPVRPAPSRSRSPTTRTHRWRPSPSTTSTS